MTFVCHAPEQNSLYVNRVTDALRLLCGGRTPPPVLVLGWLNLTNEGLQDWAVCNTELNWAQGIEVIDAALSLAGSPEEGRDHKGLGEF